MWEASFTLSSKYGFICRINIWELGRKIQRKVVRSWKRQTRATHRQCLVSMDTKSHGGSGVKRQFGLVYLVYSLILSRALRLFQSYTLALQRQHGSHVASSINVATPCWHIGPRCCCFYYLWSRPDERDIQTHSDCRRDELSVWTCRRGFGLRTQTAGLMRSLWTAYRVKPLSKMLINNERRSDWR